MSARSKNVAGLPDEDFLLDHLDRRYVEAPRRGRRPTRAPESENVVTLEKVATAPRSDDRSMKNLLSDAVQGTAEAICAVGAGVVISGKIVSKDPVRFDGEITGDINCRSITIGEDGTIEGTVIAVETVEIHGRVDGTVCGERVVLRSTAHVAGNIFHQSIAIEDGAYFEGKSRRIDDKLKSELQASSRSKVERS